MFVALSCMKDLMTQPVCNHFAGAIRPDWQPAGMLARCLLAGLGVVLSGQAALAANMYVFKDSQGNVLLTNVVGSNKKPKGNSFSRYTSQVKVTWYPDTNVHTYRNWGKTEAAVAPSYSRNRNAYDALIAQAASMHGVDQGLVKAMMHTESGFNPSARSPVGAQGLMQLMPATARRFAVSNPWDPAQNIMGGVRYLRFLISRYPNNLEYAIAAYNAGEGNVDKYRGIPPFRETQDYVRRVMSRYRNLYAGQPLPQSAPAATTTLAMNATTRNLPASPPAAYNEAGYVQSALDGLRR